MYEKTLKVASTQKIYARVNDLPYAKEKNKV